MTARPPSTATPKRRRRKRPTAIVYPKKKASRVDRDIEGSVIRDLKRLIPYLRKTRSRSAADCSTLVGDGNSLAERLGIWGVRQHGRVWPLGLLEKLLHVAWSHSQMIGTEFDVAQIGKGKFDPAKTWLGRFANIHLPEADQDTIERVQSKPPERFSNKDRADYLRVTWEMRQALKLWSFAACDMDEEQFKRACHEANKVKNREHQAAKRRAAGAKPRSQSEERSKPWKLYGVSRKTYKKRKRDGTLIELEPVTVSSDAQAAAPAKPDHQERSDLTDRLVADLET
jgi:hypothetical protein